ncbi:hypothetical protein [Natranaerobius thermophilus]|uniref:Uncharacterized protein n=1 Tax=Natranaerobius thermophilus (strain ATCC BAA-1301 / DSM 18059 / JW/NM-WN-LF) TaxID=457570 RepID=B2A2C1_NATTJ|nr:hypothetical protein [Natranaerobius thermophilus]ACB86227.1 hypothetical protein Nther_2672 [Natranaerobius thermophilus JW/NM-WN-LF]
MVDKIKGVRKTIYIKSEQALNHLEKQANQSAYITNLILKDMESADSITREEIIQLIKEYSKTSWPSGDFNLSGEAEAHREELDRDLEQSIKGTIQEFTNSS